VNDKYRVKIEPATRIGWRCQDVECLRVWVYDDESWQTVGFDTTRKRDQDEARRLAAKMISEWEANYSVVVV
jgi:hypothetical protein